MHVVAGPFSIVPSPVSLSHGRPAGTIVTHFAPARLATPMLPTSPLVTGSIAADAADPWNPGGQPAGAAGRAAGKAGGPLADTARFFSLPMTLFESLLGQRFPLPSMQQVRDTLGRVRLNCHCSDSMSCPYACIDRSKVAGMW